MTGTGMNKRSDQAAAWIYRGLWRILVEWFAVPSEPPDLPARAGESIERFRPSPEFVRYLKFWFWLGLTIIDALFLVAWLATFFVSFWLGLALAPVFFAVAILPDIVAYVGIHLRYDTTWYLLSERSLRIRRGIWTIREATITFDNIQDVKIEQGPVERYFGISNVIVETAGGGGKGHQQGAGAPQSHTGLIEGVEEAARIRDLIMARVRRSRTTGLGDEKRGELPASPSWTPAHLDLLRQIKDEAALLRRNLTS